MSRDISWPCGRCGTLRWLLLERRPGRIAIGLGELAADVVLSVMLVGSARLAAHLVVAVLVCITLGGLVRIRCVRCEPSWRTKAWKLAGRDLDG
jgi:hypothetical protein